jgi:hypothetical protein
MDTMLPRSIEDDLRFLWNDLDAAVGFHSSHGSAVNRAMGLGGAKVDSFQPFEEFACWSRPEARRRARVRNVVATLPRDVVQILYRVYGPSDPSALRGRLGELAALAEYTPTVEAERERMVEQAIDARVRAAYAREATRAAKTPTIIAETRVRAADCHAEIIRLRELRGERGLRPKERKELVRWRCELRATEARREDAERVGLSNEALARATASIRTTTEREITTRDALRSLVSANVAHVAKESHAGYLRRVRQVMHDQEPVVAQIRVECRELFEHAVATFRSTWPRATFLRLVPPVVDDGNVEAPDFDASAAMTLSEL